MRLASRAAPGRPREFVYLPALGADTTVDTLDLVVVAEMILCVKIDLTVPLLLVWSGEGVS